MLVVEYGEERRRSRRGDAVLVSLEMVSVRCPARRGGGVRKGGASGRGVELRWSEEDDTAHRSGAVVGDVTLVVRRRMTPISGGWRRREGLGACVGVGAGAWAASLLSLKEEDAKPSFWSLPSDFTRIGP
ncbi:hypothetical protein U1Q18_008586 [Sarracenia purpurea var. burkii]